MKTILYRRPTVYSNSVFEELESAAIPASVTVKGKVRFPSRDHVKHMKAPPWLRQARRKVPLHGDNVVQWHHFVTKRKMQKKCK